MGKDKKHKKSRLDRHEADESGRLRLVLKVGGSNPGSAAPGPSDGSPHQSVMFAPCGSAPPSSVAPLRLNMSALEPSSDNQLTPVYSHQPLHPPPPHWHHRKDKKHKKKKKKDKDKERHKEKRRKEKQRAGDMTYPAMFPGVPLAGGSSAVSAVYPGVSQISSNHPISMVTTAECAALPPSPDVVNDIVSAPACLVSDDRQTNSTTIGCSSSVSTSSTPSTSTSQCRPGVGRPALSAGVSDLLALGPDTDLPAGRSPLQRFLAYVQRALERKDMQSFFAAPVTDSLAPGYSSIIDKPMDFSTMREKNDSGLYSELGAFQEDFRLMCANAMVYNRMDTKYYKAAKRLLHVGCKMMHADKLNSLHSVLPYMSELTAEQLGFEPEPMSVDDAPTPVASSSGEATGQPGIAAPSGETHVSNNEPSSPAVEDVEDEAACELVRQQAEAAAQAASAKLFQRYQRPPKMGFLRRRSDGTTSLAIVAGALPEELAAASASSGGQSQPVTVGLLTGKLAQGNAQLTGYREDKRNIAKPVKPLYYGPYCSFAPMYDSTFSNISRAESELLFQTYGDETGVQYAQSLMEFTSGCEPAVQLADRLLDLLTDGQHSRTQTALTEARAVEAALSAVSGQEEAAVSEPASSVSQLRSLADHGIDVSFLDAFEDAENRERALQRQLDTNSGLVEALGTAQRTRLSHNAGTVPDPKAAPHYLPDAQEQKLADQLCGSLAKSMQHVRPGDISTVSSLHKAMGVGPVERTGPNGAHSEEVDVEAVSKRQLAVSSC